MGAIKQRDHAAYVGYDHCRQDKRQDAAGRAGNRRTIAAAFAAPLLRALQPQPGWPFAGRGQAIGFWVTSM
jgi:hypothetical protein